jgi:hypothetical protein
MMDSSSSKEQGPPRRLPLASFELNVLLTTLPFRDRQIKQQKQQATGLKPQAPDRLKGL